MTIPKKFSQALPACPAMIKTVSHAPMFSDGATVYLKLFPLSHFTLCEPNILRTNIARAILTGVLLTVPYRLCICYTSMIIQHYNVPCMDR